MDVRAVLLLSAAAHGLFQATALLLSNGKQRQANRILAALIILFSFRLIEFLAYWSKYILIFPHLTFCTATFEFLFGILLFLYIRAVLSTNTSLRGKGILHFLPFMLHLMYLTPFYLQSAGYKTYVVEHFVFSTENQVSWTFLAIRLSQILHMSVYTFLSYKLLQQNTRQNSNPQSPPPSIRPENWTRHLTLGFLGFVVIELVQTLAVISGNAYIIDIDYFKLLALATIIYAVGYAALRRPDVFGDLLVHRNGRKYEKSALPDKFAEICLERLKHEMERQNLFRDCNLNLSKLAKAIAVSPHHLSQILNERLGQNFFDFVNYHRIEAAKRLLRDPDKAGSTILAIAYDVGFNSKSSFNAAFRRMTGMTPSAFRRLSLPHTKKP